MEIAALVLAAGEGTRMKSDLPKVLHPLLDRPILAYVLQCLKDSGIDRTVVVIGHGADRVRDYLSSHGAETIVQDEQLGTGHAAACAAGSFDGFEGTVAVISGDTPLLRPETLRDFIDEHNAAGASATILTSTPADASGYGRIVRDDTGRVVRIVEQKDASDDELVITEANSSIYCFDAGKLFPALARLDTDNAQGEYYLTDVVSILADSGEKVLAHHIEDHTETMGINSRAQLAEALGVLQSRINGRWMAEGVTVMSPEQTWIGADVVIGRDATIWPQTYLLGATFVGAGSVVGPNTRVSDSKIGDGAIVEQAQVRESVIGDGASVGPFCSIRPGSVLRSGAKAGTLVEIKKTEIGRDLKMGKTNKEE